MRRKKTTLLTAVDSWQAKGSSSGIHGSIQVFFLWYSLRFQYSLTYSFTVLNCSDQRQQVVGDATTFGSQTDLKSCCFSVRIGSDIKQWVLETSFWLSPKPSNLSPFPRESSRTVCVWAPFVLVHLFIKSHTHFPYDRHQVQRLLLTFSPSLHVYGNINWLS